MGRTGQLDALQNVRSDGGISCGRLITCLQVASIFWQKARHKNHCRQTATRMSVNVSCIQVDTSIAWCWQSRSVRANSCWEHRRRLETKDSLLTTSRVVA